MLRTPAARDRIQRWAAAGGLRPDTPVARCGVIPRIACVGDVALQSLVEDALAKIPVPVLDHLRKNAVLLPIGRSCAVLTAQLPAPERDADEARHMILVEYQRVHVAIDDSERAAAAFEALLGHECAHSFLRPIVSKDEMRDAAATVERRVPAPSCRRPRR